MRSATTASQRWITFVPITLIVVGLLLGAAAPAGARPLAQSESPVTLRIAAPATVTLDPVMVSRFDRSSRDLVENLFVGLTRFDPTTQQIEPMIAESWSVSENGLTWTFNLRDDIQWVRYEAGSNEVAIVRPVQAGDFVYTIQRACDPLRPSPVTANLMIVRGCQTVANAFPEVINDLFIAREIGVRATGPYTLEIDILFPAAYFPTLTSTPEFRPLARETVANDGDWTAPDRMITNGSYALASRSASEMVLVRNPHWPNALSGNVERVEILLNDAGALLESPTADQVDMARLTPGQASALSGAATDLLFYAPGNQITAIGFAFDRAVVQIEEARRALALAIDRQALVEQFFPDEALVPGQFTPAGVVAAPQSEGFTFDAAAARSALSAAGFPECANWPEPILLLVPEGDAQWLEIARFVVDQWSTNLGCNPALFEIVPLDRAILVEMGHGTYDSETATRSHSWVVQWSADYPDANAWISDALHCRYGWIRTGRPCDQADDALDAAAVEDDTAARAEDYTLAETALFGPEGSFPVIPLYATASAWLQQPWLSGVNEYGAARFDLWTVDVAAQPER